MLAQGQLVDCKGRHPAHAVPVATIESEPLWLLSEAPGTGPLVATAIWPELTCPLHPRFLTCAALLAASLFEAETEVPEGK